MHGKIQEEDIAMKSPYLASSRISPNFSQQDLPSWAPTEERNTDLDVFAADAKLSDSPSYCLFQPSKTVHQEDSSCLKQMEHAPLPTVSPAQTVYYVEPEFPSTSGPLPPLVSSCLPFGSIASFSPASSSYSPIYSSSLTAKHSSSFGPGPSTFLTSPPSEPPSSYSSSRSIVSPFSHSASSPSIDSPEQAMARPELPLLAQFTAHPPPPLFSGSASRSFPLPALPLPICAVGLAHKATLKPFPCHPCSRGFERFEHLTRHRATDSHLRTLRAKGIPCYDPPVRMTRCPFCEHKFNRIDNLKTHLITHMHTRPGGGLRGSKSVSVEEVARVGLAGIDPRVNPRVPRVKVPKKVKNVRKARVRRS